MPQCIMGTTVLEKLSRFYLKKKKLLTVLTPQKTHFMKSSPSVSWYFIMLHVGSTRWRLLVTLIVRWCKYNRLIFTWVHTRDRHCSVVQENHIVTKRNMDSKKFSNRAAFASTAAEPPWVLQCWIPLPLTAIPALPSNTELRWHLACTLKRHIRGRLWSLFILWS